MQQYVDTKDLFGIKEFLDLLGKEVYWKDMLLLAPTQRFEGKIVGVKVFDELLDRFRVFRHEDKENFFEFGIEVIFSILGEDGNVLRTKSITFDRKMFNNKLEFIEQ